MIKFVTRNSILLLQKSEELMYLSTFEQTFHHKKSWLEDCFEMWTAFTTLYIQLCIFPISVLTDLILIIWFCNKVHVYLSVCKNVLLKAQKM